MRFSELDGQTIGVWGLGLEIRSFAQHLRERLPAADIAVVVLDDAAADATALGARVVGAGDAVEALRTCDVLVRSPGVSIHRPELRALDVPVVTATGLWLAEREGRRVVGVTGTKGKSTTATAIHHLAAAAGERVHLAGNIGLPALDLLDASADEWVVVELSSYQIADLEQGPEIAVLTNLYREHLNWHLTEETYRREKVRLLTLPGVRACVVRPADRDAATGCRNLTEFGLPGGWHADDQGIADGHGRRIPSTELPLLGRHNAENLCAALTALEAAGIAVPPLPKAFAGLKPLRHRLETVLEAGGVVWVDDSISTTPESSIAAIDTFAGRDIVLLAGGQDREQDYAALGRVAAERDLVVLGLPTTGERVVRAAREAGLAPERAIEVPDMAAAVERAARLAKPGTAVLLSPAAPSFNAYRDYKERGEHFVELARASTP